VPPDLVRHLEDDEPVRPGGEPAFAPELAELAGDGHQCVRRCLVGQVLKFGTGDPQPRAPPALPSRDAQQHLVQPRQRRLALRTPSGERTEPLG
jgi:hypothetical protein